MSGTGGLEFESPHFDQKEKRALVALFSFLTGVSDSTSLALCANGVRIPNEATEKLVFRWQVQEYCPCGNTSTLRPIITTSRTGGFHAIQFKEVDGYYKKSPNACYNQTFGLCPYHYRKSRSAKAQYSLIRSISFGLYGQ